MPVIKKKKKHSLHEGKLLHFKCGLNRVAVVTLATPDHALPSPLTLMLDPSRAKYYYAAFTYLYAFL